MLEGKRRWLYMLIVVAVLLSADLLVAGVSNNTRDVLIAISGMYIAADGYVKGKKKNGS